MNVKNYNFVKNLEKRPSTSTRYSTEYKHGDKVIVINAVIRIKW